MMEAAVPDVDRLCVRGFSNEDSEDSEDGEWLTSVVGKASAPPYSPLMVYTFGGTAVSGGGGGKIAGLPLSSPPPPSLLTMLDVVVMTESGRCSPACSDRRTVSCSYVGRSRSEAKQWVRVVPAAGGRGGKNPSSGRTGEERSVAAGS
jgi:hypothetical protein